MEGAYPISFWYQIMVPLFLKLVVFTWNGVNKLVLKYKDLKLFVRFVYFFGDFELKSFDVYKICN